MLGTAIYKDHGPFTREVKRVWFVTERHLKKGWTEVPKHRAAVKFPLSGFYAYNDREWEYIGDRL